MSTGENEESPAVDVLENTGYSDAKIGPTDDTTSFYKDTPLGAVCDATAEDLSALDEDTHTSATSSLKRSSLQRNDGGGGAADRVTGPRTLLMAAVAVLFVIVMGGIGFTAVTVKHDVEEVTTVETPKPETVDGVEVRRGIGQAPNKAK